jgi:hypothetical protein
LTGGVISDEVGVTDEGCNDCVVDKVVVALFCSEKTALTGIGEFPEEVGELTICCEV